MRRKKLGLASVNSMGISAAKDPGQLSGSRVELCSVRLMEVVLAKFKAETVAPETRENVEMHMWNFLHSRFTVGKE